MERGKWKEVRKEYTSPSLGRCIPLFVKASVLESILFDLRSSLLTLDNAQMRFGIVLAYSQPSTFHFPLSTYSYNAIGPCPKQLVVVMAVRNAVSAATRTFATISITLFFFIIKILMFNL